MSIGTEAFLDIETTGLSPDCHQITVVGIHRAGPAGSSLVQLVGDDITAASLRGALDGTGTIYTYNGSRFDLPFIQRRLGVNLADRCHHHDLMYDCWQQNLYGGLKGVERRLGIPRQLQEVNGLEAIRLWWRYVNYYDRRALATLLAYNREDVLNLTVLKERLLSYGR